MTYLKWVGSKAKLLSLLEPVFPRIFRNYYEPFVGSGALFFWMAEKDASDQEWNDAESREYCLGDTNEHLMNCHMVVAHHFAKLKERLDSFQSQDSKEFFLSQRPETVNRVQVGNDIEAAARFIYLNRRAWGGMWRVNQKGEYNVPFCETQTSPLLSKSIARCSAYLKKASLQCGDYKSIDPQEGDFVFLDPPYYPLSATANFTGYTPEDWSEDDHVGLTEYLKELDSKGVKFLMTNNDCVFIRDRCKSFNSRSQLVTRYINALTHHSKEGTESKKKREKVKEIFVWNYEQDSWSG